MVNLVNGNLVWLLISDKIDYIAKDITRNKEVHFITIQGSFHQEEIIFLNVYTSNKRASKYTKQKLIEPQEQIDKFVILIGDFNTLLSTFGQKNQ